jgi:hypothetical protein
MTSQDWPRPAGAARVRGARFARRKRERLMVIP